MTMVVGWTLVAAQRLFEVAAAAAGVGTACDEPREFYRWYYLQRRLGEGVDRRRRPCCVVVAVVSLLEEALLLSVIVQRQRHRQLDLCV